MLKLFGNTFLVITIVLLQFSCTSSKLSTPTSNMPNNQDIFWKELSALCGKAFAGTVINAPANDTVFKDHSLVMHVRICSNNVIRIPFNVGSNRSRTWVFTRMPNHIQLKHDHRHLDGTEDEVTQYGGTTSNDGSSTLQMFPADQHTVNILPAAATNVWWVELVPGKYFTYNLRRMGTDRLFTIQFDLTRTIDTPEASWGWKD